MGFELSGGLYFGIVVGNPTPILGVFLALFVYQALKVSSGSLPFGQAGLKGLNFSWISGSDLFSRGSDRVFHFGSFFGAPERFLFRRICLL